MAKQQEARALSPEDIVELANRYLRPHQPEDYRLVAQVDGVRQDDDWWYVLVRPDRDDVKAYDYYNRLAEAEVALREQEELNVLLVPVLPE